MNQKCHVNEIEIAFLTKSSKKFTHTTLKYLTSTLLTICYSTKYQRTLTISEYIPNPLHKIFNYSTITDHKVRYSVPQNTNPHQLCQIHQTRDVASDNAAKRNSFKSLNKEYPNYT